MNNPFTQVLSTRIRSTTVLAAAAIMAGLAASANAADLLPPAGPYIYGEPAPITRYVQPEAPPLPGTYDRVYVRPPMVIRRTVERPVVIERHIVVREAPPYPAYVGRPAPVDLGPPPLAPGVFVDAPF